MRQRRTIWPLAGLAWLLMLAGCATTTGSATVAATPTTLGAATATVPPSPSGDYAFIRAGDLWLRHGSGIARQVTHLALAYGTGVWGPIQWSPDHANVAVGLSAPPSAPGYTGGARSQWTGTVVVINVQTGTITRLAGATSAHTVPILGRHFAWLSPTTLLFTERGVAQRLDLAANPPTITPLNGLSDVWEVVARGATLFCSTVANITPGGVGVGEIRSLNLSAVNATSALVATLGPVTLPAAGCGLVCPPNLTTPYVPYAWDVNASGAQVVYQHAPMTPATARATTTPTPTPTATTTPTTTATPAPTSDFALETVATGATTPLFQGVTPPGQPLSLAFAPDGSRVALALAVSDAAAFGPYLQLTTNGAPQPLAPLVNGNQTIFSGVATWSPDGAGFSLTQTTSAGVTAITFLADGQHLVTELNADGLAWGA